MCNCCGCGSKVDYKCDDCGKTSKVPKECCGKPMKKQK
jgi:hypothetical protein